MLLTKRKKLVAGFMIVIVALCCAAFGFRAWMISTTETTETRAKIKNLAGADFEVIDTGVDALAHYEYVSVYIKRTGDSYFDKLVHRKTLLFQYDPWSYDAVLPSINSVGPNKIQISVPKVSSIFLQKRKWENLSVEYQIGSVEYP